MNDLTRRDDPAAAPPPRPAGAPLREVLVAQFGTAVGDAMAELELAARRKRVEELRDLQAKLAAVNAGIDARLVEHARELVPFTERMERSYATWLRHCEAREERMRLDSGALAELRGRAAELIKQINAPDPRFVVTNWQRPAGYTEPVSPPRAMPDARIPRPAPDLEELFGNGNL